MIITCPDCTTRYSVDPGVFAGGGRKVRCFNCGHLWTPGGYAATEPVAAEPPMAPRPQVAPAPSQPRAAPPPEPKPVAKPAPKPAPAPTPVATPAPKPAAAAPPAVQDEPIAMADVMAAAAAVVAAAPAPAPAAAAPTAPPRVSDRPSEQPSDEALDAMLGGQDDPSPITPLLPDDPDDDEPGLDPETLPDPDPIPEALIAEDEYNDADDDGPGIGRLIGLVGGVLVAACLGVAVFLQDMIVEMSPGLASVYQMVGLGEPLGAGFEIRQVRSSRTVENDIDTLTVDGVIANVTTKIRSVPNVRVALYDAANVEVMFYVAAAEKSELSGDDRTRFKAQLRNPPPTARRLEVTFTKDDSPDPPTMASPSAMTAPAEAAPAEMPTAGGQ